MNDAPRPRHTNHKENTTPQRTVLDPRTDRHLHVVLEHAFHRQRHDVRLRNGNARGRDESRQTKERAGEAMPRRTPRPRRRVPDRQQLRVVIVRRKLRLGGYDLGGLRRVLKPSHHRSHPALRHHQPAHRAQQTIRNHTQLAHRAHRDTNSQGLQSTKGASRLRLRPSRLRLRPSR